jgi:hypothetical protein
LYRYVPGYAPYNHQLTWHLSRRRWVRDAAGMVAGGGAEAEAYLFWIDVAASVARTTAVQFILPWIIARRLQRAFVISLLSEAPAAEGTHEERALGAVWGIVEQEEIHLDTDGAAVTMRRRVAVLLHAFLASRLEKMKQT